MRGVQRGGGSCPCIGSAGAFIQAPGAPGAVIAAGTGGGCFFAGGAFWDGCPCACAGTAGWAGGATGTATGGAGKAAAAAAATAGAPGAFTAAAAAVPGAFGVAWPAATAAAAAGVVAELAIFGFQESLSRLSGLGAWRALGGTGVLARLPARDPISHAAGPGAGTHARSGRPRGPKSVPQVLIRPATRPREGPASVPLHAASPRRIPVEPAGMPEHLQAAATVARESLRAQSRPLSPAA